MRLSRDLLRSGAWGVIRWMRERELRHDQMMQIIRACGILLDDAEYLVEKQRDPDSVDKVVEYILTFKQYGFTQEDVDEMMKMIYRDILMESLDKE